MKVQITEFNGKVALEIGEYITGNYDSRKDLYDQIGNDGADLFKNGRKAGILTLDNTGQYNITHL